MQELPKRIKNALRKIYLLKIVFRMYLYYRQRCVDFVIDLNRTGFSLSHLIGYRNLRLVSIDSLNSGKSEILVAASTSTIVPPRWGDGLPAPRVTQASAVNLRILDDCVVSAYSSGILQTNLLILPAACVRGAKRVLTDDAGLFRLTRASKAATRISENQDLTGSIDEAIFLGGAGSFNWYHFVIECLPKAFLCQKLLPGYSNIPFIVPFECKKIPQFSEILEQFTSGRQLIYLRLHEYMMVRKLLVIEEVSFGPFNLVPGEWPKVADYHQHDSVIRDFSTALKAVFLRRASKRKRGGGRHLFLARPGVRRKYNQDELIEIASKFGYEPFEPERHSLEEQARVFSEASAIIGPSGAAWVGLLFCEQPIKALSWLPKEYSEFCSYSTLAHTLGHELVVIESRYESILRNSGDAYTKSYWVSPTEFNGALRELADKLSCIK